MHVPTNLRLGVPLLLASFVLSFLLLFGGARLISEEEDGGGMAEVTEATPATDTSAGNGAPQAAVEIEGRNIQFDKRTLVVPAGQEITLTFRNSDPGVLHNVAIYTSRDARQRIFVGAIFPGVATQEYRFTAPPPGNYYFRCDVHPDTMTGTLVVQ